MQNSTSQAKDNQSLWALIALGCWLALPPGLQAAASRSPKLPIVPKWDRFEQAFRSKVAYTNPLQQATLTVRFTSPLGEVSQVDGFWDGGRTWRVRFAPDQAGRWTFRTACSDPANRGLNGRTGEFLCTAPLGPNRFRQHGLVQVARDHRHLEHADGTPFFWLADTTWNGARVSAPGDWAFYAQVRSDQQFTVAQWAVAPGTDSKGQSAFTVQASRISINPAFFQRLDAKLDTLSCAGILSAIVPLFERGAGSASGTPLPDDQAALLVRYLAARWGADPVAWLLAVDGEGQGKNLGRWKRVGREVFGTGRHAPVILYSGHTPWVADEFREESWVDAFGQQCVTEMTEDALKWTFAGPAAKEWTRQPPRPLLWFLPLENSPAAQSPGRVTADDVRRAAYWSLLLAPPAGISYGAQGVANWDVSPGPGTDKTRGAELPLWHKTLFLPGAKQMGLLAKLATSVDFWRLQPWPNAVADQPGDVSPSRQIVAAGTEAKDLALVYVPGGRTLALWIEALPASPGVAWFNPRTGQSSGIVAAVADRACQFPTPGPGDWVLVVKSGKK